MAMSLNNNEMLALIEDYLAFCDQVRAGGLGKTPQFWLSYMDHILIILKVMRSMKTNDFELYAFCISKMPDIFFSFS